MKYAIIEIHADTPFMSEAITAMENHGVRFVETLGRVRDAPLDLLRFVISHADLPPECECEGAPVKKAENLAHVRAQLVQEAYGKARLVRVECFPLLRAAVRAEGV